MFLDSHIVLRFRNSENFTIHNAPPGVSLILIFMLANVLNANLYSSILTVNRIRFTRLYLLADVR